MASTERTLPTIVEQLHEARQSGLSFEAAKEKLLAQGVSEAQISTAMDSYDYDAKSLTPAAPPEVTAFFAAHPDQAQLDANGVLKAKREEDAIDARNQALLDAGAAWGAGRFGVQGIDAETEYESKFTFDVGGSFWGLVVGQAVLLVCVYVVTQYLGLTRWLYTINGVIAAVFAGLLIKRAK